MLVIHWWDTGDVLVIYWTGVVIYWWCTGLVIYRRCTGDTGDTDAVLSKWYTGDVLVIYWTDWWHAGDILVIYWWYTYWRHTRDTLVIYWWYAGDIHHREKSFAQTYLARFLVKITNRSRLGGGGVINFLKMWFCLLLSIRNGRSNIPPPFNFKFYKVKSHWATQITPPSLMFFFYGC